VFAYRVEMSTGNQHEVATTQGSFMSHVLELYRD
jgi:hypothetical protein